MEGKLIKEAKQFKIKQNVIYRKITARQEQESESQKKMRN